MAVRRATLNDKFARIYQREPAITSADVLLEFARRDPVARHWRPKRQEAVEFLRPEGTYQVYKKFPSSGLEGLVKIQRPTHGLTLIFSIYEPKPLRPSKRSGL